MRFCQKTAIFFVFWNIPKTVLFGFLEITKNLGFGIFVFWFSKVFGFLVFWCFGFLLQKLWFLAFWLAMPKTLVFGILGFKNFGYWNFLVGLRSAGLAGLGWLGETSPAGCRGLASALIYGPRSGTNHCHNPKTPKAKVFEVFGSPKSKNQSFWWSIEVGWPGWGVPGWNELAAPD